MFVKLTNGQPDQFPYSVGQFRRDNPQTSFPKVIPDEIMRSYGVFPVTELPKPDFAPLVQTLKRDDIPHSDGIDWLIGYTVENKPLDQAQEAIRNQRNRLLSDTDWMALSDNTMTTEWASYRQALRDITTQEGFPYSVVWPIKPE